MKLFKRLFLLFIVLILVLIVCYLITSKNQYYIREKNLQIPIYTYHQIVESPSDVEIDYIASQDERI